MRLVIADPDSTSADVLRFVAERRGHEALCLGVLADLFERLPFEPHIVVLCGTFAEQGLATIERVRGAHPEAGLFVVAERLPEPLPTNILKAGANEVLRAPYNPTELVVRAEAWYANRLTRGVADDSLRLGDLELTLDRYAAIKNGHRLDLTKLELRLLYCLCHHSPHLTPTERLLMFGWDTEEDPDAALIKTHISHIRKKLRSAGGQPFEIAARQSLGYTLRAGD